MTKHYLRILSFGLIGEGPKGDNYRQVTFEDSVNSKTAEFRVHKKKRPALWKDIEDLEKGKKLPPYRGYITGYQGIDVVVFGDETIEDAFAREKWKLNISKKIRYTEAENMRKQSKGYCTNETAPGAMEISWREIDKEARMVRFRYYEGKGKFSWSKWYEIIK
jgi:hypothetical protein